MITVTEARQIISQAIEPPSPQQLRIADAGGLILANDVFSPIDVPAFDQSNMDGYAIRFSDRDRELQVTGAVPAGTVPPHALQPNTAIKVYTGSRLPDGADTVVMQERVTIINGQLQIDEPAATAGMHVRKKGSDIKAGVRALPAGTLLSPAAIGWLASIGHHSVTVYAAPSVSIIVTGNELVSSGTPLIGAQVYESTSFALRSALLEHGVKDIRTFFCTDDLEQQMSTLYRALGETDMILISGGMSFGDHDLAMMAADRCGVETLFHRVRQRPGKPLLFGKKNGKLVFGLPGNPSSSLTCLYEYVRPALNVMMCRPTHTVIFASLTGDYRKAAGLTHFLKGKYADGKVAILAAQESYKMASFALANCLVVLPEEDIHFTTGDQIEVHLI